MAAARRELAPAWREWIVENLVAGVDRPDLVATLIARGVAASAARREVAAVAASPLLPVCATLATRVRRLELAAALARYHAGHEPDPTTVERRRLPPADEFFRHYWAAHRPAVFTDATRGWPALRKWTPAWFRRTFGKVTVEITADRDADPDYDRNFAAHRTRVRMDRFLDEIAAGASNDRYLVSNNRTMMRPAFRRLLDDVRPPPGLFEPIRPGATSLWIGPAGTVTPLHHDTTNILFCQIHGRKRVELIAPSESVLLLDAAGFYSPIELDRRAASAHPAVRAMLVKTVEVGPGDALFIPAGWWHRVTSLAVSISFSLLHFRRPNRLDWYVPGR